MRRCGRAPSRSDADEGAERRGAFLRGLDRARADDDPVDERGRRAACSGVEIPKPAYSGRPVTARLRATSGARLGDSSARVPVVPVTVTR